MAGIDDGDDSLSEDSDDDMWAQKEQVKQPTPAKKLQTPIKIKNSPKKVLQEKTVQQVEYALHKTATPINQQSQTKKYTSPVKNEPKVVKNNCGFKKNPSPLVNQM